jgi:membrane-associated protease RseP (regulator of RpoE activity)
MRFAPLPSLAAFATALLLAPELVAQPSAQPTDSEDSVRNREVLVIRGAGDETIEIVAAPEPRGFLGVGLLDLTPELRRHFGAPEDRGVLVSRVLDQSPASRSGLRTGDLLTAANGVPLPSGRQLSTLIASAAKDQAVDLEYWREGRRNTVQVRVDVRERTQFDLAPIIHRKIAVRTPHVIRLRSDRGPDSVDVEWIGNLVGQLDDSVAQAAFLQQLEALREERGLLQRHIELLEKRLTALEADLHELDDD